MTLVLVNISLGALCVFGLLFIMAPNALAAEKDELASAQNLLIQVQSAIERARIAAGQDQIEPHQRYFFDYPRATTDLDAIHTGIDRYLQPSRAQPRVYSGITGIYRAEKIPE
ncbi:RAQPRD family integrative conjugative element protein [Rouxiella badensis]|uniref:integrative conjugative element protein, RAQPRD family n=1 Tax=Rouxiella badensis TaxID=1646377 RepID=UPI001D1555D0|nr:RAQPRD family integrative conjugative element protein [Rouxiella badensis]MCC3701660.1 RAQPRD family integrative conjugative element protein [Rouxiella badensis]